MVFGLHIPNSALGHVNADCMFYFVFWCVHAVSVPADPASALGPSISQTLSFSLSRVYSSQLPKPSRVTGWVRKLN